MNPNRRRAALTTVLACIALILAACGGGAQDIATPPSASNETDIRPADADPRIDTATEAHVAITPSAAANPAGKLLVFLPGTSGIPDYYRLILRSGAARGFHGIGLSYPNSDAVGVICIAQDTNCFGDVRREVITGTDYSPLVSVSNANSIVTRITKAIVYLDATYPNAGWGQYVSGDAPVWSKIIVAGHSQGGGHAGVMAKLFEMSRAVYFSAPPDWSDNAPAAWTTMPSKTLTSNQYAFGNVDDTLVPYSELAVIWQAMGLNALGSARSVDSGEAYGETHLLTTSVAGAGDLMSPTHGSTVLDVATPKDAAGAPIFDPVWAYLCFPPSE